MGGLVDENSAHGNFSAVCDDSQRKERQYVRPLRSQNPTVNEARKGHLMGSIDASPLFTNTSNSSFAQIQTARFTLSPISVIASLQHWQQLWRYYGERKKITHVDVQ